MGSRERFGAGGAGLHLGFARVPLAGGWMGGRRSGSQGRERSGLDQSVVLEGRVELAEGGACGACGPRLWSGLGLC